MEERHFETSFLYANTEFSLEQLTVHKKPVPSQHPDEHQQYREREGQELSQSETSTATKGNPGIK